MSQQIDPRLRERLQAALDAGVNALGLELEPPTLSRLLDYLALLHRWNGAYNLTAVREPEAMVVRHLLDSLAVLPLLHGRRLADIGSGAGLPGMVLALASPSLDVTLLDSAAKRIRFLNELMIRLAPENVEVVRARVEEYRCDRPFDTVTCRAFAALPDFVSRCAHLLAPGGVLLAMKGERADQELAALPAHWQRMAQVVPLAVPGLDAARYAVLLRAPD